MTHADGPADRPRSGAGRSGSRWAQEVQQTFDFAPFRIGGLVSIIALAAISVIALVLAMRTLRATRPA